MNKYEEAVRQLQKGIETYVDKKISETKFDKTYIGIITAITNNNTYSVNVKNVVYNNVPVAGNAVCKLNEIVKVLVPMSNFNNMFIINVNNDYVNNINKPTINGVEIVGNLTQEDLHIKTIDTISEFGGFIQSKGKYFNNNKNVGMSPNSDRYALWAGETNKKNGLIGGSNAYFKLKQNGELFLHSDNVENKGNLFIDFAPQDKDEIYSIYYQQSNGEMGADELIDLSDLSYPKKIEHDMVYIKTLKPNGTFEIVFNPSAYFQDMTKGFVSRISNGFGEQYKDFIPIELNNKITDKAISIGKIGAFDVSTIYDDEIERFTLSNKSNGLTVRFSLNSTKTFYAGATFNDDEKQFYIAINNWMPIYWNENPAWDSRYSNFATFSISNSNSKKNLGLEGTNCFISKSGNIYSKAGEWSPTLKERRNMLYYLIRMNCAPCYIPNYNEKVHKTVFDLVENMRGKIVCYGNGTGNIPEFEDNENDLEILRNFVVTKKILYVSRNNDLVLNAPKIKSSISLFDEQIGNTQKVLNLNKKYLIDVGRLTKTTDCPNNINAIHFEEGLDSNNNWQRKVIIETDKLVLKTKDGEVELGVKENTTTNTNNG